MSHFNFTVDRVYAVKAPLTFHPDVALMSEPFTLEAGGTIVYRGTVELGGSPRFVFDLGEGKKGYTRDRNQLVPALVEDYDALLKGLKVPKPEHHLFVCKNERAADNPRGSCAHAGAEAVLKCFKEEVSARGLRGRVMFDGSTCLDTCAHGPVVAVYPENTWYGKVTPADVPAILDAIANGTVVERLLVPEEAVGKS